MTSEVNGRAMVCNVERLVGFPNTGGQLALVGVVELKVRHWWL
jgi:hypothetical protein